VQFILFIQNICYIFSCGQEHARARPEDGLRHSAPGLKEGKNFFIWIRRNPLKSPDSAKGIQGKSKLFSLDFLGFSLDLFGVNIGHAT
jgi:hypothetical protein